MSNEAVKCSDVAVLSHFDYTSIIWALEIDFVIFGFELNGLGMFGKIFIIISGLKIAISRIKLRQTT